MKTYRRSVNTQRQGQIPACRSDDRIPPPRDPAPPVALSPAAGPSRSPAASAGRSSDRRRSAFDAVSLAGAWRVRWRSTGGPDRSRVDFYHPVHDETGVEVLGVCETDPDMPGDGLVSRLQQRQGWRTVRSGGQHRRARTRPPRVRRPGRRAGRCARRYRSVTQGTARRWTARPAGSKRGPTWSWARCWLRQFCCTRGSLRLRARGAFLQLTRAHHGRRPGSPVAVATRAGRGRRDRRAR